MTPGLKLLSIASTRIVTRAIIERPDVLAEFVFEVIGSATARTRSDQEAAERIAVFAEQIAGSRWMIERAPELQALALTGALADIDWLAVVAAITEACARDGGAAGSSTGLIGSRVALVSFRVRAETSTLRPEMLVARG